MSEGKTMITNHNSFLEILKTVLKLMQKSFPTMEQKLVQHGETKVVADACNPSYQCCDDNTLNCYSTVPDNTVQFCTVRCPL